jgi:hypothetical protein
MKKMGAIDWIAFILVAIGALSWGLIGLFEWDIVAAIFGDMTTVARVVYTIIGIAALYRIVTIGMVGSKE